MFIIHHVRKYNILNVHRYIHVMFLHEYLKLDY